MERRRKVRPSEFRRSDNANTPAPSAPKINPDISTSDGTTRIDINATISCCNGYPNECVRILSKRNLKVLDSHTQIFQGTPNRSHGVALVATKRRALHNGQFRRGFGE
jgi:hypothetical protein